MDDTSAINCLEFKERFWYPEMMSNYSHWVPTADDPLSCLTEPSLYDVKLLANCFVVQENVRFTHFRLKHELEHGKS